jgi:DNA-binding beta-propeller fold protein YncE
MAINSAGTTVYVVDSSQQPHGIFFPDRKLSMAPGGSRALPPGISSSSPQGVAINSAGTTVYVADTQNNRVEYFSTTGSLLWHMGNFGQRQRALQLYPSALTVNSAGTTVYVVDEGNTTAWSIFHPDRRLSGLLGGQSSSNAEFLRILWESASIRPAPQWLSRIRPTTAWNILTRMEPTWASWGSAGSGNNNFIDPVGAAVNQAGTTIYVGDSTLDQVKYFTAQ